MSKDLRRAITQAKFNEESYIFVCGSLVLIAILLGVYFQSWAVFGWVLCSFILIFIPTVAPYFMLAVSGFWAMIAYAIGLLISSDSSGPFWKVEPTPLAFIFAVIAFILSLGLHVSALEHLDDIGHEIK